MNREYVSGAHSSPGLSQLLLVWNAGPQASRRALPSGPIAVIRGTPEPVIRQAMFSWSPTPSGQQTRKHQQAPQRGTVSGAFHQRNAVHASSDRGRRAASRRTERDSGRP